MSKRAYNLTLFSIVLSIDLVFCYLLFGWQLAVFSGLMLTLFCYIGYQILPTSDGEKKSSEIYRYVQPVKREVQPYIVSDPTKPLQVNVENAIRRFNPRQKWEYERQYQDELYNWLKREFPVEIEVQTGSSRPDLIIKNIAIEIKGPTGKKELDTLTTKFLKYSNHYPHFIIVLFDCNFSEGHYNEICSGIRKFAPNVKIIRK